MRIRSNPNYSFWMSGSGLLWCWGFLHFFWSQAALSGAGGSALGDLPYLGSTLLVSLVVASVSSSSMSLRFQQRLAALGCALLVLGIVLSVASQVVEAAASELRLLADIVQGGGIGVFFIAWGCLYTRSETEAVEYAFLGWFPLLVVLLAMAAAINLLDRGEAVLYSALLILLPVASLVSFRMSVRSVDAQCGGGALPDDSSEKGGEDSASRGTVVWPLLNLACVFAATSLAWNAFLFRTAIGFEGQIVMFAVGIVVLFVIIWLALRMTRHFSLSTLYRWSLPLMTVGVVLYQFSAEDCHVLVFLCLSIVNTGFEVMGKLLCIYIAKRGPKYAVSVIAVGFAAASMGGILGTCMWAGILSRFGAYSADNTLLVALVVFVVAVSFALGKDHVPHSSTRDCAAPRIFSDSANDPDSEEDNGGQDELTSRCIALAERYGLSSRELEVLILLSQGRSRAHIREALYISKGTVDSHIHHIYSKTGISSKDELMRQLLD